MLSKVYSSLNSFFRKDFWLWSTLLADWFCIEVKVHLTQCVLRVHLSDQPVAPINLNRFALNQSHRFLNLLILHPREPPLVRHVALIQRSEALPGDIFVLLAYRC